jgi:hypothetical protein
VSENVNKENKISLKELILLLASEEYSELLHWLVDNFSFSEDEMAIYEQLCNI